MKPAFASRADLTEKKTTFAELAPGVFAYTAEGDPNSAVVVGDASVLVVEAQATPVLAEKLIEKIRAVTDKPIRHLVLSHYHAVRVLGASAFGAAQIYASDATHEMIVERGAQDFRSEVERFPRLFQAVETVPGLTWPSVTFSGRMTLRLGRREVQLLQLGAGHTRGDIVTWLPEEKIMFSGDLVEAGATPYCGDAQLADWPGTLRQLDALRAEQLVPGRGEARRDARAAREAIDGTQRFVTQLLEEARAGVAAGEDLATVYRRAHTRLNPEFGHWYIFEHCLPFNVSRAYDEASGTSHPRIWTAERDAEMWNALQNARLT